jgi:hypothetical protein
LIININYCGSKKIVKKMEKIKALARSRYKNYQGNPFELTDGQAEIFECIATRKYPRIHALSYTQYGKSDTVAMAVLTRITTFPEKWAIVAPSNKKARIIMSYIIDHTFDNEYTMSLFEIDKGESIDRIRRERSKERMTFRLPNGEISEVFTLSSEGKRTKDLLDALMGFGAPNVIIDESSLIDDVQYVGILRMLGGHTDNFLFEIGNAMRRNHFYKASFDPKYHHISIDCEQGYREGRITREFIDEMRNKPMFEMLYMNKFPKADAIDEAGYTPLISDELLQSKTREIVPIVGQMRWACDVAGEGSNYSVIVERGKNGARVLYRENNPDTMNFVSVIVDMYEKAERKPTQIYIDKVGIGKPVFDRLLEFRDISETIVGVMAGEKPQDDTNYFNRRAEMFWRLKEWLGVGELEGNVWTDLLDIKYKVQSDRKIKIKSKDEMLKDGIMSPDVADALSFTFYHREDIEPMEHYLFANINKEPSNPAE